jgi:beta-fructofuranosidase
VRPGLHLTAATGWINDPHGITFHDGRYHLFHQYVPDSPTWAPGCHWAHATSTDLLTWTSHGVALAPGDGDDGVWTGALVDDGSRTRILYTSVAAPDLALGRVRAAVPVDGSWDRWAKGDVVAGPPDDLDLVAFRDPFVMREGSGWRMLVGAATRDGEALALGYTSRDLVDWAYDGVTARRSTHETEPVWMGALWECPQLLEVDGRWVLLASAWDADVLHHVGYGIGDLEDGRFTASGWGRLTFGDSYYAASSFRDRDGHPCVMFWLRGVADPDGAWAGCLSVPFHLSVGDGRLVASPHLAVAAARGPRLAAGEPAPAFDVSWRPPARGGHLVLADGSGSQTARVVAGPDGLALERPGHDPWRMPWRGEPLSVLVDGPVVEVASAAGLLGGPVEPASTWHASGGACEAWAVRARQS